MFYHLKLNLTEIGYSEICHFKNHLENIPREVRYMICVGPSEDVCAALGRCRQNVVASITDVFSFFPIRLLSSRKGLS